MKEKDSAQTNEIEKYWTQAEVARRLRKSEGTIKNWRDQGLLSFFRPQGSRSVLYLMDEVKDFENQNTTYRKGGDATEKLTGIKRVKPVVSPNDDDDWRI